MGYVCTVRIFTDFLFFYLRQQALMLSKSLWNNFIAEFAKLMVDVHVVS